MRRMKMKTLAQALDLISKTSYREDPYEDAHAKVSVMIGALRQATGGEQ